MQSWPTLRSSSVFIRDGSRCGQAQRLGTVRAAASGRLVGDADSSGDREPRTPGAIRS